MFLDIEEPREKIGDVVGIYLIAPTESNLSQIENDLSYRLYDYTWINFLSPCPDSLLEAFAFNIGKLGSQDSILEINDTFINFFAITDKLFSLEINNAFVKMHNDANINYIAQGIYAVLRVINVIPIICFDKTDDVGERVAFQIHLIFKNAFEQGEINTVEVNPYNRTLLVLLNRHLGMNSIF